MDIYFHPTVPESERQGLMASNLWRPTLQLITKAAPLVALKCIRFRADLKRVALGNDVGLHIVSLSQHSGSYNLEAADFPLNRSCTTQASSKKSGYVVNAAFKRGSNAANAFAVAVKDADPKECLIERINSDIVWRYRANVSHTTSSSGKYDIKDAVSSAAINSLLDAYAHGVTEDMLTPELRGAMDKLRKHKADSEERIATRTTRIKTMFTNDKWYVAYHGHGEGYYLAAFNAYAKACSISDAPAPEILMPLRYYRNLADLPEEVVAKLTMMAVVVKGKEPDMLFMDKQTLFPARDVFVDGANYMCDTRGGNFSSVAFDR